MTLCQHSTDRMSFQEGMRIAGEELPEPLGLFLCEVFEVSKEFLLVSFDLLCASSLNAQTDLVGLDSAHVKELAKDVKHLLLIYQKSAGRSQNLIEPPTMSCPKPIALATHISIIQAHSKKYNSDRERRTILLVPITQGFINENLLYRQQQLIKGQQRKETFDNHSQLTVVQCAK